ncbi:hypothetical protein ETB91_14150 [Lacticaseibacillus rhamnosus]|nr:hypothetical protein [Lacticaseibacillus rhamnosus]RXS51429.1 hypothetical protein ETB91_14150 [Lacticaseibacillus rhamnosus]TLQ23471.1 hypothetical protein FEZ43_11805 [Lacticaseibacillus rhamnosus]
MKKKLRSAFKASRSCHSQWHLLVKTMFLIRVNFYEGFTQYCLFLFIQTGLESWLEGVLDLKVKEIGKNCSLSVYIEAVTWYSHFVE